MAVIAYCASCHVQRHFYTAADGALRCAYGHAIPAPGVSAA